MTVKEFLKRYDDGEHFDEKELEIIFDLDFDEDDDDIIAIIEEEYSDPRRWTRLHLRWVNINERFFELVADEALTELQDNHYDRQPREVKLTQVKRTVVVTENEWTYVKR